MELPPLSPGIQDKVMDVVVVLVTVRRGWSGGTVVRNREKKSNLFLYKWFKQGSGTRGNSESGVPQGCVLGLNFFLKMQCVTFLKKTI